MLNQELLPFSKSLFEKLTNSGGLYCVSMYVPMYKKGKEQNDHLAQDNLKHCIKEVTNKLKKHQLSENEIKKYLNPIEVADEMTQILKAQEKCDLVICLSHLGFKYTNDPEKVCDVLLAQKTKHIDLIIGGHTHTFLDKPIVETNREGQPVLINQVGCFGINLGRIDFYFSDDKQYETKTRSIIL